MGSLPALLLNTCKHAASSLISQSWPLPSIGNQTQVLVKCQTLPVMFVPPAIHVEDFFAGGQARRQRTGVPSLQLLSQTLLPAAPDGVAWAFEVPKDRTFSWSHSLGILGVCSWPEDTQAHSPPTLGSACCLPFPFPSPHCFLLGLQTHIQGP